MNLKNTYDLVKQKALPGLYIAFGAATGIATFALMPEDGLTTKAGIYQTMAFSVIGMWLFVGGCEKLKPLEGDENNPNNNDKEKGNQFNRNNRLYYPKMSASSDRYENNTSLVKIYLSDNENPNFHQNSVTTKPALPEHILQGL